MISGLKKRIHQGIEILKNQSGPNRNINIVYDYNVKNVSLKVERLIASYIDYVNRGFGKRILIYTNHFYPEQFKINEIVDWLSNESYYIRVITCIPNYPKGSFYKGYGFFDIQ